MASNSSGNCVEHNVTGKITFNTLDSGCLRAVVSDDITGSIAIANTKTASTDTLLLNNDLVNMTSPYFFERSMQKGSKAGNCKWQIPNATVTIAH
jgi:hypothetical protein